MNVHHINHFAELLDAAVGAVAAAATRGWLPEDLRHVLGHRADHLLFLAHHRVGRHASPAMRRAWADQCPAVPRPDWTAPELADWWTALSALPELPDEQILLLPRQLRDAGSTPEHLDAVQRRACHRITALLRKAESTGFEAEAESLVAKAQQLRHRHRITTLLDEGGAQGRGPGPVALRVHFHAPWVRHQFLLLAQVASANSCRAVLLSTRGIATIIGERGDVCHSADLFASLNRQCLYGMRTSTGARRAARRGETTVYRRSFLLAYAHRIGDLLQEAGAEACADIPTASSALPVLMKRAETATQRARELFPTLRGLSFSARHHQGSLDGILAAEHSRLAGEAAALQPRSA